MTTVVTSMRFACRRRTAADWTSGNEILLAGEIGYETDTDKFKIGDGVTRWNSISGYFSKTGGSGSAAWGAITGTLTDQTDLVAALALKVPTSRTVNGLALSANITLSASDVGADPSGAAAAAQAYAIQRANHTGTQAQSTITNLVSDLALKADLVGGVVPSAQIPAIAITEFLGSVANQSAMLALSGQKGDWCIRTDLSMVYVITGTDPTLLSDWTGMAYPTAPVLSVNGYTGAVTLAPSDLDLVIGTDVQAYDADLAAIAALTPSNDDILQRKSGAWTNRTLAQLAADLGVPTLSADNPWTGHNTFAAGTLTASEPFAVSQTWNSASVTFEGFLLDYTSTASAAGSLGFNMKVGGASVFAITKTGSLSVPSAFRITEASGNYLEFGSVTTKLSFGVNDTLDITNGTRTLQIYSGGFAGVGMVLTGPNQTTAVSVEGGSATSDAAPAPAGIKGGNARSSATTNLVGADTYVYGGSGASSSSGNAHGGNVRISGGQNYGTGHRGYILLENLPTSSPGVTGAIWNDSGVLKVS